jgi:hypothetical protein
MDASWHYFGGSGQDDYQSYSTVFEDTFDANSVKTGVKTTRTTTERDPSDVADISGKITYTGESRVMVEKFDNDGKFLGVVETITLKDGNRIELEFNENWEIVGEYSLGEGGARIVTDPYQLFPLGKMNIDDAYMEAFAATRGITDFVDGDGDGEADVFSDDYDGDGVSDLVFDFGRTMLDSTVFADGATRVLTKNAAGDIDGFQITANGYSLKMMGVFSYDAPDATTQAAIDAALAAYDTSVNSVTESVSGPPTIIENGLTMAQKDLLDDRGYLHDDYTLMDTTDPMYGLDMQRVTGNVDSIYVYDTTNNNNAMANSTGLDINFADLGAFFCGQTH